MSVKVTSSLAGGEGGSGRILQTGVLTGASPSTSRRKMLRTPATVPATRLVAVDWKAT